MNDGHSEYYANNPEYTRFLESQNIASFQKYADFIKRFSSDGDRILDVGCGTGIAFGLLRQEGVDRELIGIDISKTSVDVCHDKVIKCHTYNGKQIPFENSYFDLVGSFNVLEHTEYPEEFLGEMLRVTKVGGHLVVACPNFLSITNSYHYHTRGVVRKLRNLFELIMKKTGHGLGFEKMEVVVREDIQPDDDACIVTNPVAILDWARRNCLELEYWSSQSEYRKGIVNYLDFSLLRLFLGSSFMVFGKQESFPGLKSIFSSWCMERERLTPGVTDNVVLDYHLARYRFASDYVKDKEVLDVACGNGYGSDYLFHWGKAKSVIGVDISEEAVKYASSHYGTRNLSFMVCDATRLQFDDESFDVVVSFETVEHIRDHEQFMLEVRRVLRPGGTLVISTPNKKYESRNLFHVISFSPGDFKQFLGKVFKDFEMYGQGRLGTLGSVFAITNKMAGYIVPGKIIEALYSIKVRHKPDLAVGEYEVISVTDFKKCRNLIAVCRK